MAEIFTQGEHTVIIADIQDGGYETLMVVQPPEDIEPELWRRSLVVSALENWTDELDELHEEIDSVGAQMIAPLVSTGGVSLFAIKTSIGKDDIRHSEDNPRHLPMDVLKGAAQLALVAKALTRGSVNAETLDGLNDWLSRH